MTTTRSLTILGTFMLAVPLMPACGGKVGADQEAIGAGGAVQGEAGAAPDAKTEASVGGADAGDANGSGGAAGAGGAHAEGGQSTGGTGGDALDSGPEAENETGVGGSAGAAEDAEAGSAPECIPGATKCNGEVPEVCGQDGYWVEEAACGSNAVCVSGTCKPFPPVARFTAGNGHSCALTASRGVMCWGENQFGQLGDGSVAESHVPVAVSGLSSGVLAVVAGDYHTCAITDAGGVKCWGSNLQVGQVINDPALPITTPVDVIGLNSGVVAVAGGDSHSCAITEAGGVKCWGFNDRGQLGNGTTDNSAVPVDVLGLTSGATAVAAGGSHPCALLAQGNVKCWGANYSGQLGNNIPQGSLVPVEVVGLGPNVQAVSAGWRHTCAITESGGARCWGSNHEGQLGDGSIGQSHVPVDVVGLPSGMRTVACGGEHTCGITLNDELMCWGSRAFGQLGDGTYQLSHEPVQVVGLASGVTAVATGEHHTCALTKAEGLWCWGYNPDGRLGDGSTEDSNVPVSVVGF